MKKVLLKEVFGAGSTDSYHRGQIKRGQTFEDTLKGLRDMIDIGTTITDVESPQSKDSLEIMLDSLMSLFDDMTDIVEALDSQRDS